MLEGKHYQNAYITRDMDKAIKSFGDRADVRNVTPFDASVMVDTPAGRGILQNRLAFIWVNNLQYELIQPLSGMGEIYTDVLPADDSLLFHHVAMRVDDWDVFRAKVERQQYRVVLEGGSETLRFLYLDARDFLGHYLEYVWASPESWAAMAGQ